MFYHVIKPPFSCSCLSQSLSAFILQSSEVYSFLSVSLFSHLRGTGLNNHGYYGFPLLGSWECPHLAYRFAQKASYLSLLYAAGTHPLSEFLSLPYTAGPHPLPEFLTFHYATGPHPLSEFLTFHYAAGTPPFLWVLHSSAYIDHCSGGLKLI